MGEEKKTWKSRLQWDIIKFKQQKCGAFITAVHCCRATLMCVWCAGRKRRKKCHWNGNCRRNRAELLLRRALHVSDTPITWICMAVMNHRGDHGPLMEPGNRCKSWASLGIREGKHFHLERRMGKFQNGKDKWEKNGRGREEKEKPAVVFFPAAGWLPCLHDEPLQLSACKHSSSVWLCVVTLSVFKQCYHRFDGGHGTLRCYSVQTFHPFVIRLYLIFHYAARCLSVGGREGVLCWFNTYLSSSLHATWIMYL